MQFDTNAPRNGALAETIAASAEGEADLIVVRIVFDLRTKQIQVSIEKTKTGSEM